MIGFWPIFLIAILATWRLTHLLVKEDGPGGIIVKMRSSVGNGFWGALMDCFYCLSMWYALPLSFLVPCKLYLTPFVWLAISGAASLLEQATKKDNE